MGRSSSYARPSLRYGKVATGAHSAGTYHDANAFVILEKPYLRYRVVSIFRDLTTDCRQTPLLSFSMIPATAATFRGYLGTSCPLRIQDTAQETWQAGLPLGNLNLALPQLILCIHRLTRVPADDNILLKPIRGPDRGTQAKSRSLRGAPHSAQTTLQHRNNICIPPATSFRFHALSISST
jgi:hypothetical protein